MKTKKMQKLVLLAFIIFSTFACQSCDKSENGAAPDNQNQPNSNTNAKTPDWLIGTWEGSVPSNGSSYSGQKVRIVFTNYELKRQEEPATGVTVKTYLYSGTFTWNYGGSNPWTRNFSHSVWPEITSTIFLWECTQMHG